MISAFGVEHGDEVAKGLGSAAKTVGLNAKAAGQSYKLARLHGKKALSDAGYKRGVKGFKESFGAGMKGNAKQYGAGRKQALRGARANAKEDITDIMSGRKPGQRMFSAGSGDIMSAGLKRGMSQIDRRLKL